MAAPDTTVSDIAEFMLAEIVERLEDIDNFDMPARQYIHAGQVAYDFGGEDEDCTSLLVVTWTRSYTGNPGDEFGDVPLKCELPRSAQFEVHLIRCVPTLDHDGNPPTAEMLTDAAIQILNDHRALSNAIYKAYKAGELVPVACGAVGLGEAIPYGPEGEAGGVIQALTVGLV